MPPETRYARNGEVSIAYQVVGSGPLDLVVGWGWPSHLDYFWEDSGYARFVGRLASFARVIVYDQRGTGLSDPVSPDALPTFAGRVDDLRAVVDAAGAARAALFGVAEGGVLAAAFAARYPERVPALILFAGYARGSPAPDYPWGPGPAEYAASHEGGRERSIDVSAVLPSTGEDEAARAWWQSFVRRSAGPAAVGALARMNCEIDVRAILPEIRAPTLILHRVDDAVVSVEHGRYLARQIPGATIVELPGADHLPFAGDQEAVLDPIERFLRAAGLLRELDRVLATVLAVEIVGAAETAARLGDRHWGALQVVCRWMIRDLVARHGGRVLAPALDGAVAVFDDPAAAVACGRALAAGVNRLGLHARAGIHSGELVIVPRELVADAGPDLAGIAVYLAVRIMGQAEPGAVLVSGTVRDLLAGKGIEMEPAGDRVFPGLPGEWEIFRLAGRRPPVGDRPPVAGEEREAARSAATLSPREREVAALLAVGLSNRQIADELVITVATAERHVANILTKLGFRSRAQVAAWAVEQGLILPASPDG